MTSSNDDTHSSGSENAVNAVLPRENVSLPHTDPKVVTCLHPRGAPFVEEGKPERWCIITKTQRRLSRDVDSWGERVPAVVNLSAREAWGRSTNQRRCQVLLGAATELRQLCPGQYRSFVERMTTHMSASSVGGQKGRFLASSYRSEACGYSSGGKQRHYATYATKGTQRTASSLRGSRAVLIRSASSSTSARAQIETTRNVSADSVRLGTNANLGDVQTNRLVDSGSTHGGITGMVALPPLPTPSPVSPATSNISVGTGKTLSLSLKAAAFGANAQATALVIVPNGTLRSAPMLPSGVRC
jgi:hypothetical protein